MSFKGRMGFNVMTVLGSVYLNGGPYETSEGITPVARREKN
jgi:hypothetical protein